MKLYVMQFPTAADAVAAVAANPAAYEPGTLIFAVQETTMHYVVSAGTLSGALAIAV